MNVTIENLGPCKKLVRFEVDAAAVDKALDEAAGEIQRQARLPGFRPGKAPREMVLKSFEGQILEEAKKRLMGETYRAGIKEQNLNVLNVVDIEEIQFGRGQALQFAATVELAPEFELPEYRGLHARREQAVVTDADVDRAVNALRGQRATFETVDRPAAENDIVVVSYKGTCEGRPISEIDPGAPSLNEQKNFWIEMKPESFIPGFYEQLNGAKAGEHRTVTVDFPADLASPQLAGKKGVYEVDIVEIKQRNLPALDDAFAKTYDAPSLDKLREGVRMDLQNEMNSRQRRGVRNQILAALLEKVTFDLPESSVERETRNIVYEIVSENQRRGVARDLIEKQKDEIYAAANKTARDRVKIGFLFHRISEKEGIRATEGEVSNRIVALAANYNMPPAKFAKEVQKRDGLGEIYQQIIHEKVTNFLQDNARIEDVAPAAPPA